MRLMSVAVPKQLSSPLRYLLSCWDDICTVQYIQTLPFPNSCRKRHPRQQHLNAEIRPLGLQRLTRFGAVGAHLRCTCQGDGPMRW
jgi:hypothetical protein